MEYRRLGRTGLKVSALGLGTGQFGRFGQTTESDCLEVAHCAFDGGINLVDTADFYSSGEAERILGKAIAGRRDKLIVSTKCGMPIGEGPNERGGSRKWIMNSIEKSLRNLQTDHVDLYQLHAPDPETEVEETVSAMEDLIRQGKIRYYGFSNSSALDVVSTVLRARLIGAMSPHVEQQSYSLFVRGPEAELLPMCATYGVGVLAYSPLDGGWLSGRYRRDRAAEVSARQRLQPAKYDMKLAANQRKLEIIELLASLAADAGLSLNDLAVAFVLAHPVIDSTLIGSRNVHQTEQYLAGLQVRLSEEILDVIDTITAPGADFETQQRMTSALADKSLRRRPATLVAVQNAEADSIRKIVQLEGRGSN